LCRRGMSRDTVRSEMSMPSLSNSPWMRGCAPSEVLSRHSADQITDILGCQRATWALPKRLPTPERAEGAAVAADHCVGTDDDEGVSPVCPTDESQAQKILSVRLSRSRLGLARRRIASCWRRAKLSRASSLRVRTRERRDPMAATSTESTTDCALLAALAAYPRAPPRTW
jgi:hypothetical protein